MQTRGRPVCSMRQRADWRGPASGDQPPSADGRSNWESWVSALAMIERHLKVEGAEQAKVLECTPNKLWPEPPQLNNAKGIDSGRVREEKAVDEQHYGQFVTDGKTCG